MSRFIVVPAPVTVRDDAGKLVLVDGNEDGVFTFFSFVRSALRHPDIAKGIKSTRDQSAFRKSFAGKVAGDVVEVQSVEWWETLRRVADEQTREVLHPLLVEASDTFIAAICDATTTDPRARKAAAKAASADAKA